MVTIGLIFVEAAHENVYELLLRQINFTTPSNEFLLKGIVLLNPD